MTENRNGARTITEIIRDGVTVNEAFDKAFYRAVPLTFSEHGKMVIVDAKDIPIPERYANLEPFRY